MQTAVALPADVTLLPGDTDVNGDGILDYEAIDVDTGNVIRFDIYPTAATVRGSYPEGDYRLDLDEFFRTETLLRIQSTGRRFVRVNWDAEHACEVTEVEVLQYLNGSAEDLNFYSPGIILVNSRWFNAYRVAEKPNLSGFSNGVDKGLGIEPGKEYLMFIIDRVGKFVGDEDCPFWDSQTLYRSGIGSGGTLWEIDGPELKNTLLYGLPYDYGVTDSNLFATESSGAAGASGSSASENLYGDDRVLNLNLSEVLKLANDQD